MLFAFHTRQVLSYAQQSRERSNYDQAALIERMQEFKRQIDRESRWSPSVPTHSPSALGDGIQAIGRSSHKMIEAVMQSAASGKVLHFFHLSISFCICRWFVYSRCCKQIQWGFEFNLLPYISQLISSFLKPLVKKLS
jgi:hypothetical protein